MITLVVPGFAKLKEWAYAGFTFAWISAFVAHYLAKDGPKAFMPLILLLLLAVSYVTRPASRQWQAKRAKFATQPQPGRAEIDTTGLRAYVFARRGKPKSEIPAQRSEVSDNDKSSWLVSNAAKLLGLYIGYVFLSGWAFLDSYFRFFGMDPKSLDIGFYEILIKGFTILFSESRLRILSDTSSLWLVYIALLVVPIILEEKLKASLKLRVGMILFFAGLLLAVYFIARRAGEQRARLDTGESTRLSGITFRLQNQTYHGKLVLFRGGTYFIHGVAPIPEPSRGVELSIYRAEELREVKVTEHQ